MALPPLEMLNTAGIEKSLETLEAEIGLRRLEEAKQNGESLASTMTKREYMATHLLSGCFSDPDWDGDSLGIVRAADKLLQDLGKYENR